MLETGPKQIEFGHVCEDPDEWEQRYERRDEETKRYQGKVGKARRMRSQYTFACHCMALYCLSLTP